MDLGFTSQMEQSLDHIADGELNWKSYLQGIYSGPEGLLATVQSQQDKINPEEARSIKLEGLDKYEFHVGRMGPMLRLSGEMIL